MGDTARFGGVRASFHGERRGAPALRWRKRSSSDNNGTPQAARDRATPGRRVPTEREAFALGVVRRIIRSGIEPGGSRLGLAGAPLLKLHDHPVDVRGKQGERRSVGLGTDPDDDVRCQIGRQDPRSRELPQATLDSISRYGGLPKPRNDQADTSVPPGRMHERGSDCPNLEERGSDSLPLFPDSPKFGASCDARTSRESERRVGRVRLRRTCPGCGP